MSNEKKQGCKFKSKKPITKRWWFWLLIVLVVLSLLFGGGSDSDTEDTQDATTSSDVIELIAGELGSYGKTITMSEGTDMEEELIVYYVPKGTYTVKNVGDKSVQVSIYEGIAKDESSGYDDYTNVGDVALIDAGDSAEMHVPDGWFIEIQAPAHIELSAK